MADRIESVFQYTGMGWGTDVDKLQKYLAMQDTVDMYARAGQRKKSTKKFSDVLRRKLAGEGAEAEGEGEETEI
ncbi:MAG: hypothetical protein HYV63_11720 [Candidatus Schekmanbacteria bacterium]|nr:hypothetical protein [Candidatus Schekmanbacteria bacterium]